ncbi:protein FAR1-RELATED SEQUENCE 5-like [Helianthus annuus]|uniref:protein FAR1-RELATED SEQUENCE 5-like n=1 Tax=Helianthus annuus TaxID=4232 RepID=UPI0016531119|nr:protein FAR1-RELATED SEQUENCE 5-like [Helianthus annuus]
MTSSITNGSIDFEENRPIGDHAQLSAYQRVSIEDVLNPRPANPIPIPIPISSSSAANQFSIDERVYTPEVQASATPVVGIQFISIEQAYAFYQSYAKLAGFSIRKGGEVYSGGIIKTKYFVCSKEGHKPLCIDDHSKSKKQFKTRNRGTIRTGCKAQLMICTLDDRLYTVKKFVDGHNHKFVCQNDIHMLPAYRQLSDVQEEMVWELGTLNLGLVKAFQIMRKRYGGFENVSATVDDCKNFRKRINSYIGEYDADMLNYIEFGDVISFDATFKTNRYKMVFVPFTGIDNHCRNVTVSAGLLASESIESYKWLLNSFLKSFGRQPNVVVTDQDPTMKQAIEEVGHELCNIDEFKRRMCDIVWTDSIEPEEFERQWKLVMIEFGLTENKWIDDMFGMRSMWIPAFYRHEPMSGLMRTTSRSESHDIRTCGELKAKQQGKQGKKKMKGVLIEDGVRDKVNEGEDDEGEDDFEDYSNDDGSEDEDQWEEVSVDDEDE